MNGGDDDGDGPDARPGSGGDEFADARPAEACNKMDIVFVVDDSGSMGEEQANLATNFPTFVSVIEQFQTSSGDFLDYRLAVTTTGRDLDYVIDVEVPPGFPFDPPPISFSERGDNGAFRQDCGMTRKWLERGDANVGSTFSCVAQVGTGGPSIEMPLHALELAFTARMSDGTNAGFLRDDALLALIILTDEDDCSRSDNNFTVSSDSCDPELPENPPVSYYTNFLDGVAGDRGRWAVAVIAGPGPGTCTSDFGDAFEAKRLKQFVTETGDNAVFSSICDGNLAAALDDALTTFQAACENFPQIE